MVATVADFSHISVVVFFCILLFYFFPNLHSGANVTNVVQILAPRG